MQRFLPHWHSSFCYFVCSCYFHSALLMIVTDITFLAYMIVFSKVKTAAAQFCGKRADLEFPVLHLWVCVFGSFTQILFIFIYF